LEISNVAHRHAADLVADGTTFPADRAQVILDGSNSTNKYCHPGNYRLRSKSMHGLAPPEIRAKILVIDFFDQ